VNPVIKKFQYGKDTVTLETGRIARQATAAVVVTVGQTCVLCTVVGAKEPSPGQDFFPLSVHSRKKATLLAVSLVAFLSAKAAPLKKKL